MHKPALAAAVALLAARPAAAIEVVPGRLSLDGAGQWAYGRSSGGNTFQTGAMSTAPDGEFENAAFTLTLAATPAERLTLFVQTTLQEVPDGLDTELDWTFGEYLVSDLLRIRAGKIKLPFGLSTETRNVGTLRPFFELPPSMYGPTDLSIAYRGAGVTGSWLADSGWGFAYDVYGGAISFREVSNIDVLVEAPPAGTPVRTEQLDVTDVIGGRASLFTPVEGLGFKLSGYHGTLEGGGFNAAAISAEYLTERWSVRAEAFQLAEKETNRGGYLEVARFFGRHLQAAVRGEALNTDFPAYGADHSLLRHRAASVGLNWWLTPAAVIKAAYHYVDGNRLAFPLLLGDSVAAGTLKSTTHAFTVGTQFTL